jgi:hypothetical protein
MIESLYTMENVEDVIVMAFTVMVATEFSLLILLYTFTTYVVFVKGFALYVEELAPSMRVSIVPTRVYHL